MFNSESISVVVNYCKKKIEKINCFEMIDSKLNVNI